MNLNYLWQRALVTLVRVLMISQFFWMTVTGRVRCKRCHLSSPHAVWEHVAMLWEGNTVYASLVSNLMQHLLDSHWPLFLHLKPSNNFFFLTCIVSAGIEGFISNVFRKDSVQEKLAKSCKLQACLGLSKLWYEPQRNSREMTTPFHVMFWLPLGDEQWNMWLLKRNMPNREEEGLDILVWIYVERGKAVRQQGFVFTAHFSSFLGQKR